MPKLITVMLPCYNEVDNVLPMHDAIVQQFKYHLASYDYRILYIDNYSTDGTRDLLREMVKNDSHVQVILNSRNFGQFNSPFHAMCCAEGDALISMCCDFQDPVEIIPRLVKKWEEGHDVVCAIKGQSEENGITRAFRTCYYKLINKMSSIEQIEHFTGTGLYSRAFLDTLKNLDDPEPFLRGIVAELAPANRAEIQYVQAKRRAGKTGNNLATLYDAAMLSFTTYTKTPLRICTIIGVLTGIISILLVLAYLFSWLFGSPVDQIGITPTLLVVAVFGSAHLLFLGLIGEYVLTINSRVLKRPLVIEDERLGMWNDAEPADGKRL